MDFKKEAEMNEDKVVAELAEKHGFMDGKMVGGKQTLFTCEHGACEKSGCECGCHGQDPNNPRRIELKVNPDFEAAIREAISLTRKQVLEEEVNRDKAEQLRLETEHNEYRAAELRRLASTPTLGDSK